MILLEVIPYGFMVVLIGCPNGKLHYANNRSHFTRIEDHIDGTMGAI